MCRSYISTLVTVCFVSTVNAAPDPAKPDSAKPDPAKPDPPKLEILATVLTVPSSKPCLERSVAVTVRYRVDRVIKGAASRPKEVLVSHLCPRRARGWTRSARGDAPRIHPGDRHHLLLREKRELPTVRPFRSSDKIIVDPFDASTPRFVALSTNRAPWPPRIIVTVSGNGGTNHRITFDKRLVTVGSSPTDDVYLDDRRIAPAHLRLVANDAAVTIHGRATIDGQPTRKPTAVSYRSQVVIGPYRLNIVLLTKPWYAPHS